MPKRIYRQLSAVIFTIFRVWLGLQWLNAGWHKFGAFDATGYLTDSINKIYNGVFPFRTWYAAILDSIILPNVKVINVLVPWGEMLVGFGLIVGALTLPALVGGAFMNTNFYLSGAFSTNPTLLALAIFLIIFKNETIHYSLDRFLFPNIYEKVKRKKMINHVHEAV
ncbi:DoxX family protein [Bacillus niameyensis]|uniref:DoxX family protein n=1 Tax=Bacillus niameyensis TaxID=1522308 RepID=UPI000783CCE7|nr:DoxX family membrane protein [Bacillus niameyensis]